MSGAQIPSTAGIDPQIRRVLDAMKENIEVTKGRRSTKLAPLVSTATNAEIIGKINEIITRLQG